MMDKAEIQKMHEAYSKVMELVNDCGLDANSIIAVLTKCLVTYAVHVENREEFYMRMAMTYDFEKSQQPDSKEIH